MTEHRAKVIARGIELRLDWISNRCAEVRAAAEDGDPLAERFWEMLEDNQIPPMTNVNSIADDAVRALKETR